MDFYEKVSVADDVYIKRGEDNEPEAVRASYEKIKRAYNGDSVKIDGEDPVYRAAAYVCLLLGQKHRSL